MSTALTEAEAGMAAYRRLEHLLPEEAERALRFIKARLEADQRGREAVQNAEVEPKVWTVERGLHEGEWWPDRSDALTDADAQPWQVLEVCGHGTVRQEFVVMVPVDDGGGINYEPETFPTRDAAEDYVRRMQAEGPE